MLLERLKIYFQNVKSKIMSGQYVIVICAFVLAQLLMTSIVVYRYQKDKDITYNKALITYWINRSDKRMLYSFGLD